MKPEMNLMKLLTKIKNFFFCLRYPFYKEHNVWTDKFLGYSFTEYDSIPDGWKKAFGKQLSRDLKKAIKKDKCMDTFRFTQIKEKWGELCLYANGFGPETNRVLCYYEHLSKAYCINCGKPARYVSDGWIEYYCEECFNEILSIRYDGEKDIDTIIDKCCNAKEKCRLTKDDIGIFISKDEELQKLIDSIDWYELWDLRKEDTK